MFVWPGFGILKQSAGHSQICQATHLTCLGDSRESVSHLPPSHPLPRPHRTVCSQPLIARHTPSSTVTSHSRAASSPISSPPPRVLLSTAVSSLLHSQIPPAPPPRSVRVSQRFLRHEIPPRQLPFGSTVQSSSSSKSSGAVIFHSDGHH